MCHRKTKSRFIRIRRSVLLLAATILIPLLLICLPGFQVSSWQTVWSPQDVDKGVYKHGWPFVFLTRVTESSDMQWAVEQYIDNTIGKEKSLQLSPSKYDDDLNVTFLLSEDSSPVWCSASNWNLFHGKAFRIHWFGLAANFASVLFIYLVVAIALEVRLRRRGRIFRFSLLDILCAIVVFAVCFAFVFENHKQYVKDKEIGDQLYGKFENVCPKVLQPVWLERLVGGRLPQLTKRCTKIFLMKSYIQDIQSLANEKQLHNDIENEETRFPPDSKIDIEFINRLTSQLRWLKSLSTEYIDQEELRQLECLSRVRKFEIPSYPYFENWSLLEKYPNIVSVRICRDISDFDEAQQFRALLKNDHLRTVIFYDLKLSDDDLQNLIDSNLKMIKFDLCEFEESSIPQLEKLALEKSVALKVCSLVDSDPYVWKFLEFESGKIRIREE